MKVGLNAEAIVTIAETRRRLLTGAAMLPLLMAIGFPLRARAAAQPIPPALRALDTAAMDLFDAAEIGNWPAARQALGRAQGAADSASGMESDFVGASGQLSDFFQARNHLTGELIEAQTALAVEDRRWLVNCAGRIAARAGELARPFADQSDALTPRIEALLFLARRIRQARVWQDDIGFDVAQDDFRRLWQSLRTDLHGEPESRIAALDQALIRVGKSRSSADLRALYAATRGLREPADR